MFDLVSTSQAAEILGISPRRVQTLVNEQRLVAMRVGRANLIVRASLVAFQRHQPWHQLALQRQAEFQAQWDEWEREQAEWEQQQAPLPDQEQNPPQQLDKRPQQPEQ